MFHVVSSFSNLSLSSDLGFFWLPFECSGFLHFIDQVVFEGVELAILLRDFLCCHPVSGL